MATIKIVEPIELLEIIDGVDRIVRRGDGRRYRRLIHNHPELVIPESRQLGEVSSTAIKLRRPHICSAAKDPMSGLLQAEPAIVVFGSTKGIDRSAQSKAVLTQNWDDVYFILTWSDVFGYSIKESALAERDIKTEIRTEYCRKATEAEKEAVADALAALAL